LSYAGGEIQHFINNDAVSQQKNRGNRVSISELPPGPFRPCRGHGNAAPDVLTGGVSAISGTSRKSPAGRTTDTLSRFPCSRSLFIITNCCGFRKLLFAREPASSSVRFNSNHVRHLWPTVHRKAPSGRPSSTQGTHRTPKQRAHGGQKKCKTAFFRSRHSPKAVFPSIFCPVPGMFDSRRRPTATVFARIHQMPVTSTPTTLSFAGLVTPAWPISSTPNSRRSRRRKRITKKNKKNEELRGKTFLEKGSHPKPPFQRLLGSTCELAFPPVFTRR